MSLFGQMEAEWRDQQSGARDQRYDEEQVDERDDEGSVGMEAGAIADAASPFLPKPSKVGESVICDQAAAGNGAPKQGSEDDKGWLPARKSMAAGEVEKDAA